MNLVSKIVLCFLCLFIFSQKQYAQGSIVPNGNDAYHIMDRLEIRTGIATPYHSSLKYYLRKDITSYALKVDTMYGNLSTLDVQDLNYIFRDNNEWLGLTEYPTTLVHPKEGEMAQAEMSRTNKRYFARKPILNYFYRTPANFYEGYSKFFHVKVNPMIDFKMAKDADDSELVFLNRRGVEVRGGIDDRIFFYSNIIESQARFPNYVNHRVNRDRAIPGQGFYKSYISSVFDITNGRDYLNSEAYLGFNATKHVGIQFGYGRNRIGEGYRSLLLSDFANNYLHLKLNTRVWRIHYQNIFAELTPFSTNDPRATDPIQRKYMAAHFLNFNITSQLSFGFFEAVILNRSNQFELQYLNPLILYRTIEGSIGSPDNVVLGLNAKWNFLNRFQLYGQFSLDEFKLDEVREGGWWGNKYGIQAGLKYINAFNIDHLDAQVEYNSVRPYTYSHGDTLNSFTHYNQALAHPVGANFREVLFKVRYQPFHRLVFDSRMILINYGEDSSTENWGNNILISNRTRVRDYDNEIGQGIGTQTILLGMDVSYQLFHNFYLDVHYFYRKQDSDDNVLDNTTNYIGGGFRMNIGQTRMDF